MHNPSKTIASMSERIVSQSSRKAGDADLKNVELEVRASRSGRSGRDRDCSKFVKGEDYKWQQQ